MDAQGDRFLSPITEQAPNPPTQSRWSVVDHVNQSWMSDTLFEFGSEETGIVLSSEYRAWSCAIGPKGKASKWPWFALPRDHTTFACNHYEPDPPSPMPLQLWLQVRVGCGIRHPARQPRSYEQGEAPQAVGQRLRFGGGRAGGGGQKSRQTGSTPACGVHRPDQKCLGGVGGVRVRFAFSS